MQARVIIPMSSLYRPKTPNLSPANITSRQAKGVTRPFAVQVSPHYTCDPNLWHIISTIKHNNQTKPQTKTMQAVNNNRKCKTRF